MTRVWDQFPPHVLRDQVLLADGRRGALCGPRGDLTWLCAPAWDSPPVFSGLVGGAGVYAVTPREPYVWGGWYEPDSLVWHHRWVTPEAEVECLDALAFPGEADRVVLLRRVMASEVPARVEIVLDVRAEFGRRRMAGLHRGDDGTWTGHSGGLDFRWSGAAGAVRRPEGLVLHETVPPGRHLDLVLEIGRLGDRPVDPDEAWPSVRAAWTREAPDLGETVAPRDAGHATAVLRGLTEPGGGMVAAASLGLPERARAGRNYDYRYVWLRDQAYAGQAAAVAGPLSLLDDAVAFATARLLEHGPGLAPAYRTDGSPVPDEHEPPGVDLPGYPGGRVVVGNHVNDQFQLDTLGEVLQLFAAAARRDRWHAETERAARIAVEGIERRWDAPEAGIWELDDRWWTQSRLACVAGLRSLARHVPARDAGRLGSLADRVLAATSARCLDPDGTWRRAPDLPGPDASTVLSPVRGALPASDPRTRATLRRVRDELTEDGYVYRFRPSDRSLGEDEGAFLLCGFALATAYHHQGEAVAAARWFERTRAACGPPGLLAEEFDVSERQLRGNLPQAFVHAMLLETSARLAADPGGATV